MDQTNNTTNAAPTVPNFPPESAVATPEPAMPSPAVPPPPVAGLPPQMPLTPDSSGGSKKMMMIIVIIILVLAILGVGGWYFMYGMPKTSTSETPVTEESTTQTQEDLTNLQTETEQIEVTDPSGAMVEVDKDITLLEATPAATDK